MDLEVFLQTAGKGLHGELIYNADLFEESTARRIAKHFQVVAPRVYLLVTINTFTALHNILIV